jgi:hypothetical protein
LSHGVSARYLTKEMVDRARTDPDFYRAFNEAVAFAWQVHANPFKSDVGPITSILDDRSPRRQYYFPSSGACGIVRQTVPEEVLRSVWKGKSEIVPTAILHQSEGEVAVPDIRKMQPSDFMIPPSKCPISGQIKFSIH